MTLEISEDYCLDQDYDDINSMDLELDQLSTACSAINEHGMQRSTFSTLKLAGLLNGTSVDALAAESFSGNRLDDGEAEMVMEALTDKLKEKVGQWSAKILTFVKNMSTKLISGLDGLWTKVKGITQSLITATWDKTKAAGRTIKAHPFKAAMAAAAAVAAVAGIIMLVSSGAPGAYANESALKSFLYRIQDAIKGLGSKWPFGNVTTEVIDGKNVITVAVKANDAAAVVGNADKLGWSQSAIKAVSGQLSKAWASLKSAASALVSPVISAFKKIDAVAGDAADNINVRVTEKTGSKFAGWASKQIVGKVYTTALWSVVGVLYKLVNDVARKAMSTISETFTSLKSVTNQKEQTA